MAVKKKGQKGEKFKNLQKSKRNKILQNASSSFAHHCQVHLVRKLNIATSQRGPSLDHIYINKIIIKGY